MALVTGASRGIGGYTAYELARNRGQIVVVAKSTKDSPNRHFAEAVCGLHLGTLSEHMITPTITNTGEQRDLSLSDR